MIRCTLQGAVLEVEIHRPEKKNALTGEMYTGLSAAIDRAAGDAAVRAVLITGTREVYCSGNDIADFLQRPPSSEASPVMQFLARIQAAEKPIVAATRTTMATEPTTTDRRGSLQRDGTAAVGAGRK